MARQSKGITYEKSTGWYRCCVNGKRPRLSKDKREAERMYRKLVADADNPSRRSTRRVTGQVTVGECLRAFLNHVKLNLAPNTLVKHRPALRSFEQFAGSKTPVNKLVVGDATRWINQEYLSRDESLSRNTIVKTRASLKTCFKWCQEQGMIDESPFSNLKAGVYEPGRKFWTDDQVQAVLDLWKEDAGFRDLILFMRLTGVRVQEARVIEATHVNLGQRTVVLPGKINSAELSRARRRVITLSQDAAKIVRRNMELYDQGPIFRNSKGGPWKANAISLRLRRAAKDLGFKVAPKDLRHSWATDYLMSGGSLTAGAELMGHTNQTMMLTNYQHLADVGEHLRDETDRIDAGKFAV